MSKAPKIARKNKHCMIDTDLLKKVFETKQVNQIQKMKC